MSHDCYDVAVIGGGLAGLTTATVLSKRGLKVIVCEQHSYPAHKVCGEYISNEVRPFIESFGLLPSALGAREIKNIQITSSNGRQCKGSLDLGGFAISRYVFDEAFSKIAERHGAEVCTNSKVLKVNYNGDGYTLILPGDQSVNAKLVVAAYGKRSRLDLTEGRLSNDSSGYLGVKYHIRTNHNPNEIDLHFFSRGYAGLVGIEDGKANLCFLYKKRSNEAVRSLSSLQDEVLCKNISLKEIFDTAEFINGPETIHQVSLKNKPKVHRGILYCGDAAGMIPPLCGNGMAMAIHSGKMLSESILNNLIGTSQQDIQQRVAVDYLKQWNNKFRLRLQAGRILQRCSLSDTTSSVMIGLLGKSEGLLKNVLKHTHGEVI